MKSSERCPTSRPWTVKLARKPKKVLAALPRDIQRRIGLAIEQIRRDPYTAGEKLKGYDLYKHRVGVYRVVYCIDDCTLIITITRIAHRRDAYNDLSSL